MHTLQHENLKYISGGSANPYLLMMSKLAGAGALAPVTMVGLAAIFYPSVGMPIVNGIMGVATYPGKLAWQAGKSGYASVKGYLTPGKKLIDNQIIE